MLSPDSLTSTIRKPIAAAVSLAVLVVSLLFAAPAGADDAVTNGEERPIGEIIWIDIADDAAGGLLVTAIAAFALEDDSEDAALDVWLEEGAQLTVFDGEGLPIARLVVTKPRLRAFAELGDCPAGERWCRGRLEGVRDVTSDDPDAVTDPSLVFEGDRLASGDTLPGAEIAGDPAMVGRIVALAVREGRLAGIVELPIDAGATLGDVWRVFAGDGACVGKATLWTQVDSGAPEGMAWFGAFFSRLTRTDQMFQGDRVSMADSLPPLDNAVAPGDGDGDVDPSVAMGRVISAREITGGFAVIVEFPLGTDLDVGDLLNVFDVDEPANPVGTFLVALVGEEEPGQTTLRAGGTLRPVADAELGDAASVVGLVVSDVDELPGADGHDHDNGSDEGGADE